MNTVLLITTIILKLARPTEPVLKPIYENKANYEAINPLEQERFFLIDCNQGYETISLLVKAKSSEKLNIQFPKEKNPTMAPDCHLTKTDDVIEVIERIR